MGEALRRTLAGSRALSGKRVFPNAARLEPFGAIIQLIRPRALVFVDRKRARRLGLAPGPDPTVWRDVDDDGRVGRSVLTAPLEAHLQLTNRCDAGCRGCYTAATSRGAAGEWGLEQWKRAIDELAAMGVFHLALGGGESAVLPWLGEVAAHARERGLIPNLTTSGLTGLDNLLATVHRFGQINVSLDGLGSTYARVRGFDGFARADRAIRALRARKAEIGINVVVTRHNFDQLGDLFAYARRCRLNEVELLRFKPAGRGAHAFSSTTCTDAQHRRFLPEILRAARRQRIRVRVDCSYTPMVVHHRPDPDFLASLAVYGCIGGDFLIGARASGLVTACSFAPPPPDRPTVDQLARYWPGKDAFARFRNWRQAAEPCASCTYHEMCRGGCNVVSGHVLGDGNLPDPECPRVVDWTAQRGQNAEQRYGAVRARNRLPVVM